MVKEITALCVISDKTSICTTLDKPPRSSILCGLHLQSGTSLSQTLALKKMPETSSDYDNQMYLVVYDFLYNKENEEIDSEVSFETNSKSKEKKLHSENNTAHAILNSQELATAESNFMKQLSSYYKTLIPGESDEVFIPPTTSLKKIDGSQLIAFDDLKFVGSKLIAFDDYINFKSDLSPNDHGLENKEYSTVENNDVSISDHITELKKNKSRKKLNYSRAVQCVRLPSQCRGLGTAKIVDIIPTDDQKYVLVVVNASSSSRSFLILYALDFSHNVVKLKEEPVYLKELAKNEYPIEIHPLPFINKFEEKSEKISEACGSITMVCIDGAVRVVNLSNLRVNCVAQIENESFVSAAYCNSKY